MEKREREKEKSERGLTKEKKIKSIAEEEIPPIRISPVPPFIE